MLALARFWTWVGTLFIPAGFGWTLFVTNALPDKPSAIGLLVSRAYFGLLVTLIVAAALAWAAGLYVRLAKRARAPLLVPPNTTFEDETTRNRVISWGTVFVFLIAMIAALAVFGGRYSESVLYRWDEPRPLANGFWQSRGVAHKLGCNHEPCFALQQRIESATVTNHGTIQYFLYLSDGVLIVFALFTLAGTTLLITECLTRPPPLSYDL
ncbi:MAG: hypothetical protein WA733_15730 [Methylocystis sp.]